MKEAMWALGIFGLSLFALLMINTFGSITVTNQFNYTTMKNTVEAAMNDALDIPHFRTGFCLCSNLDKVGGKWVFENSSQYAITDPVDNACQTGSYKKCELLEGEYKINKKVFAESLVRRFAQVVGNNREYQIIIQDIIEYPPKVSVAIKSKDNQPLGDGSFTISNQIDSIIETKSIE